MPNTLLTPAQITREALRILHNNLVHVKGINRQYSSEFANTGAKIGSTVNVRKPNRYFVRKGPAAQVQSTTESYVPLTLNTQWGADVAFSTAELTLSIDDFGKRILAPQMAKIASQIDQDGLSAAALGYYTANSGVVYVNPVFTCVGTAGTTPGTGGGAATGLAQYNAPIVYLNAGQMLDYSAAPRDENRRVVMNPAAHAQSVAGLSGLFNDSEAIGGQYKKGVLGQALGFEFAMDQNIAVYSTNSGATGAFTTAGVTTNATLNTVTISTTAGYTTNSVSVTSVTTGTIAAGTIFTIAGVYAVNPENQLSTGQLAQFALTADVSTTTTGTLTFYPPLKVAGTGVADGTVALPSAPSTTAAVTFLTGNATAINSPQNLAYHQDAFTFATADLELPGGVDFAARETYDGISMRIVRAYDVSNDQLICRIDVLGGFANLRPELAVRILG